MEKIIFAFQVGAGVVLGFFAGAFYEHVSLVKNNYPENNCHLVILLVRRIENTLRTKFNARGKDLLQLADSSSLPKSTTKKLKKISTELDYFVHTDETFDRKHYIELYEDICSDLQKYQNEK
jgi:hypothetical protein